MHMQFDKIEADQSATAFSPPDAAWPNSRDLPNYTGRGFFIQTCYDIFAVAFAVLFLTISAGCIPLALFLMFVVR